MKIDGLLDERCIAVKRSVSSKEEALEEALALMEKSGKIKDMEAYRRQVYQREKEASTGIGEQIAIPHGVCSAVAAPALSVLLIKEGVEFGAADARPVKLIFLLAVPEAEKDLHLKMLSSIAAMMTKEGAAMEMMNVADEKHLLELIRRMGGQQDELL
ncbi:MAG: PTS sugar transporter subunit IIA [Eubacteriales bacterium]|nr:PTS sugar transporter subunit IIA [Eubacteriales bacterium]